MRASTCSRQCHDEGSCRTKSVSSSSCDKEIKTTHNLLEVLEEGSLLAALGPVVHVLAVPHNVIKVVLVPVVGARRAMRGRTVLWELADKAGLIPLAELLGVTAIGEVVL